MNRKPIYSVIVTAPTTKTCLYLHAVGYGKTAYRHCRKVFHSLSDARAAANEFKFGRVVDYNDKPVDASLEGVTHD